LWFGALKPLRGELSYFQGKRAVITGDYKKAKAHLTEALTYDPHNTLTEQILAQLYLFGEKDYKRALNLLRDSISHFNGDTTGWSSHLLAGVCNFQLGRPDEAEADIRKTLYYNPNQEDAQKMLAGLEDVKKK
jgi:tetratricopeptide (TPR) repeat protein